MIKYLIIILLMASAFTATVIEMSVTERVNELQVAISEQQEVLVSSIGTSTEVESIIEEPFVMAKSILPQQELPSVYSALIPVTSSPIQSIAITSSKPITIMEQEIKPVPMPITHTEPVSTQATEVPREPENKYVPPSVSFFILTDGSDSVEASKGDLIVIAWKAIGQSPLKCMLGDKEVSQEGSEEIIAEESTTINFTCVDVRSAEKIKKQVTITVK